MKIKSIAHKELDRVGIDFKRMLEEVKAERFRREKDKKMRSHKRICLGLCNLYKQNNNFREILLNAEMPDLEEGPQ